MLQKKLRYDFRLNNNAIKKFILVCSGIKMCVKNYGIHIKIRINYIEQKIAIGPQTKYHLRDNSF